jgi:hypothetical protein
MKLNCSGARSIYCNHSLVVRALLCITVTLVIARLTVWQLHDKILADFAAHISRQ